VKREIGAGRLAPGRAPSPFRALAEELVVSVTTVKRAYEELEREGIICRRVPPLFIISVGTSLQEGEAEHVRRRVYEFSPPGWDRKNPLGQETERLCKKFKSPPDRCTGGAAKFLTAIRTEIIPLLAAKFPIDTSQLGLFGMSAGGFFATWVMFQPNTPFNKYIISSPAMAYGNGEAFRLEADYAKTHKDLAVGLYMSAGALEATDPLLEVLGEVVSGMSHLAGVLGSRWYPGLKLTVEYHPGMNHNDVVGTTVVRGLRTLYANPQAHGF